MNFDTIALEARKYALQNAVQFHGTANEKAVIGKVVASLRKDGVSPAEIIPIVRSIVQEINTMSLDDQHAELKHIAPELLQKEKKERDFSLPPLPFAEKGSVITRFPPEPNGYLHIGHAKAAIIDCEYARLYDGTFILRFDDTNPDNAHHEFYEAQREDLRWLGISWDREYNTSDNLQKHYQLAEQLIRQGDAYICKCTPEMIKEGRFHAKVCSCRHRSPGEHLDLWKKVVQSRDIKGAILRLKGDMGDDNTAMRDPTLFRVIETRHPLTDDMYHVWPTYDFAGAVEDSLSGVTHPFRTKEYELRDPVYFRILSLLNLRAPHLMEFSRLSIQGMPVSKRKIKPLIDQGLVSGFDDIRLPTLRGLRRRGIVPEAIKQFIFSQGISKVESSVDFSLVESYNRKILDSQVKRFYFVPDPIKLVVSNASKRMVTMKCHPTFEMGERKIHTSSTFFIARNDVALMNIGDVFRLKGLYNVRITHLETDQVHGSYAGDDVLPESMKIQWTTEHNIPMKIFVPHLLFDGETFNPNSLEIIEGVAEEAVTTLQDGDIVQFERVGFIRLEQQGTSFIGYFSHK